MNRLTKLAIVMAVAWLSIAASPAMAIEGVMTYSVKGAYDDVKQDIEDGIVDAGLKVDYRGHIADMLKRTGKDVGSSRNIYRQAEFFQFCSARLSRRAMEADPANMAICPYVIFIYESEDRPGTVIAGYKKPQGAPGEKSQKAVAAIDKMLDDIVREATGR